MYKMYFIGHNKVTQLWHNSYGILSKKYINTLAYIDINIPKTTFYNPEEVTRYIETLALVGENRIEIIEDSTNNFKDFVNKLHPLQLVRSLNAYSHLKFSNKNILKTVLARNEEMCEKSSPKRALELITLYKSLNLSHELILKDLSKCLIKHMNNYSYELYNLGLNASYLNIDDPVFIESYKTQTLLKTSELNQLNSIKNAASFSRFRVECPEMTENLWNNRNNLDIKKIILLMSTFSRLNDERYKIMADTLTNEINNKELSTEEVSTILTLLKANSVAHIGTIETIINWLEMNLKNQNYIKSQLMYHLFMLAQLVPEKIEKKLWNLLLDKIFSSIEGFLDSTRMVQMITILSILKSVNFIENRNEIKSHIKSCYQKLNMKQQNQLHNCLYLLYENSKDEIFRRIVREARPSKLPLMCGNMKNVKLAENGSKNILYKLGDSGKLVAQKCLAENEVISIIKEEVDMVLSPTTLLDLKVLKKLHNDSEEYSNKIEIIILNEKLKKLHGIGESK